MPDILDGESVIVKGSGSATYTLKNSGGIYSCTCPSWMHQSIGIERRTCKHIRAYRGDEAETTRLGNAELSGKPAKPVRVLAPGEVATPDDDEGPPLLLAHKWETDIDLAGWWLSEKLDGVRAYWDGTQFISRLGNKFFAPPWFIKDFPSTPLDGELWGGRKLFQRTVGIVKRQDESELWRELSFMVFDAPRHGGIFEERVQFIEETVAALNIAWLKAHAHNRCESTGQLLEELKRVEALGGEGLMARQPRSQYEAGRSNTLYKVKTFHDTEARVVEHQDGMGKHKGRLGALVVELADGTRFNVGTGFSDAERENPPAIGSIITFRYQELSDAGVPRFPSYVGERIDQKLTPLPSKQPQAQAAAVTATPIPSDHQKATTMTVRRFEMTDGDTRYFWEIDTQGSKQSVRFGTFDDKEKVFEDADEASENSAKKIAEKIAKGFVEIGAAAPKKKANPFDDEDEAPAAKPAPKAAAPAPVASVAPAPPAPKPAAAAPVASASGARYYEFVEGASAKFWEIRVEGTSFFTRYGKIGTDGQMTQKDFDSEAKAQTEAEKLVAEKTKKGYVEK